MCMNSTLLHLVHHTTAPDESSSWLSWHWDWEWEGRLDISTMATFVIAIEENTEAKADPLAKRHIYLRVATCYDHRFVEYVETNRAGEAIFLSLIGSTWCSRHVCWSTEWKQNQKSHLLPKEFRSFQCQPRGCSTWALPSGSVGQELTRPPRLDLWRCSCLPPPNTPTVGGWVYNRGHQFIIRTLGAKSPLQEGVEIKIC